MAAACWMRQPVIATLRTLFGEDEAMAYPTWRRMLEEAKRQAVAAMDEYTARPATIGTSSGT
jgi:hypothetical protein